MAGYQQRCEQLQEITKAALDWGRSAIKDSEADYETDEKFNAMVDVTDRLEIKLLELIRKYDS